MTPTLPIERLIDLQRKREEIDREIKLIEDGIRKASFDACMASQLVTINEARIADGKKPLSMAMFLSGCAEDERP